MIVDPKKANNKDVDKIVEDGRKRNEKLKDGEKEEVNIVLYSNGFRVGDSELRSYEDPKNKQFMEDIMKQ